MEFNKSDWIGKWINFEEFIESEEPAMIKTWSEAEEMATKVPALSKMFSNGVRNFWRMACNTKTEQVSEGIYGIEISESKNGVFIGWTGKDKDSLGEYEYVLKEILPKGLEGKENFVLFAENAPEDWPFRWFIAMAPMPERTARDNGGLISHIHFQWGTNREDILKEDGSLVKPMWYPTICDAKGDLLEQCNITRALHHLPKWDKLPD